MELEEAVKHALDGNAILFVGSGFSVGAKNMNSMSFGIASDVAARLQAACGYSPEDMTDDLSLAAEIFTRQHGPSKLLQFLKREFTCSSTTDSQKLIASLPWKRIYTTNYDDVIETAAKGNAKLWSPVTVSDKINTLCGIKDTCVHLNGYINKLQLSTLSSEFKLTRSSYIAEDFLQSDWKLQFQSDLESSDAIVFAGYSMSADLDIQRIIAHTKQLQNKTILIVHTSEKKANLQILNNFGHVFPIGCEGFAKEIKNIQTSYLPQQKINNNYRCFKKIMIPNAGQAITMDDAFDLFFKGYIKEDKLYVSLLDSSKNKYFIYRERLDAVVAACQDGINLLVHSDLGNGKTLFLYGLMFKLQQIGYNVYQFVQRTEGFEGEVEQICQESADKVVFVFDDYAGCQAELKILKRFRSSQHIILADRTATHEACSYMIEDYFGYFEEFDLNNLMPSEITQFTDILDTYGLWQEKSNWSRTAKEGYIQRKCRASIKDTILNLLNSPTIIARFQKIINGIQNRTDFYQEILFILIAGVAHLDVDFDDLVNAFDTYTVNRSDFRNNYQVKELIDFESGVVRAKSPILAETLINKIVDPRIAEEVLLKVYKKYDTYYYNPNISWMLRRLMVFTNVQKIISISDTQGAFFINDYYDNIKECKSCKSNPHFWLQFAISKLAQGDYSMARAFFETAYSYAEKDSHFDPYQIDNHYARFLLENAINRGDISDCMQAFEDAHKILTDPTHRNDVKYYPYRVGINYYPFYQKFYKDLESEEKNKFILACRELLMCLNTYIQTSQIASNRIDVKNTKEKLILILKAEAPNELPIEE